MTATTPAPAITPAPPTTPTPAATPAKSSAPTRARRIWLEVAVVASVFLAGLGLFVVNFGLSVDSGADDTTLRFAGLFFLDLLLGLLAVGLVTLRRLAPLTIAILLAVIAAASSFAVPAALLALVSLATHRKTRDIAIAIAVWLVSGAAAALLGIDLVGLPLTPVDLALTLVIVALLLSVAVAIGVSIGSRRALVASLRAQAALVEEEQRLREDAARDHERARIAREMHDSLAHRLSLTAMHASALRYRDDLQPAERDAVVETVHDNARASLSELRDILAVVRAPESRDPGPHTEHTAPDRPQPTLDDLDDLIATATAATPVETRVTVDTRTLHPTTSRHAYRIVQECLTNARRHAPGAPVTLTVAGTVGESLAITVTNPTNPTDPTIPTTAPTTPGFGLIGIEERVRAVHGTLDLTTGPDEFRVEVTLPWSITA
ncbi:histidine kinase [Microbacterium chocolatum]|uniref:sensor histidine kinase n=1 Tax=Microbacterium aurantiacum TaxID=162393 RepID=UPI00338D56B1